MTHLPPDENDQTAMRGSPSPIARTEAVGAGFDEEPTRLQAAPLEPNIVLAGRYRLGEKIGEGGMGSVYRGEHVTIGKAVAVKVLPAGQSEGPGNLVKRFLREAQTASKIRHAHIVDITDFGQAPDGSMFYVMEFLDGEELEATMQRHGRLDWPRARGFIVQMLDALDAAHAAGFVHRDMKPQNCLRITHDGDPDYLKLIDFGIAKAEESVEKLTQTGLVIGTPAYMSPEQAQAAAVDSRTDLYSVGAILFEMLTGRVPFAGRNPLDIVMKAATTPTPVPSEVCPEAGISPALDAVIMKALEKKPADRWQSAAEFREAIEAIDRPGTVGPDGTPLAVPAAPVSPAVGDAGSSNVAVLSGVAIGLAVLAILLWVVLG